MNEELEKVNENLQEADEELDTGIEVDNAELDASSDAAESGDSEGRDSEESKIDYEQLVREDVLALAGEFPELRELRDVTELPDPLRYAALRDLGLTPAEAYLATSAKKRRADNRSHLYAVRTVTASRKGAMSEAELAAAREIFVGVPDSQIRHLYKRVTN